jgi:hypothetical protein
LGTGAVFAGVVPDTGDVAVGAELFVSAQDCGSAIEHAMDGLPDSVLHRMRPFIGGIMLPQNVLNGRVVHDIEYYYWLFKQYRLSVYLVQQWFRQNPC